MEDPMPATRPAAVPRRAVRRRTAAVLLVAALGGSAAFAAPAGAHAAALKRGSRGAVVVRVQRELGLAADGVYGPHTVRAVRRFQRRHGLTVDGVVGPRTAAALGVRLAHARARHAGRHHGRNARAHVPVRLARIARCESGGDPRAVSSDGTYRGKYQFDRSTWQAIGGHGDPVHATEHEQDRLALRLYRARGAAPWPICGRER
jgi:hypothetical protein